MVRHIALAIVGLCTLISTARAGIVTGDKIDINRVHHNNAAFDTTAGHYGPEVTYGGGRGGGEFLVREIVGNTVIWDAAFKTFCIEYSENISLGGDYWVTIDDRALSGGPGFSGPPLPYNPDLGPGSYGDPIGDATKWLYGSYVTDQLSGVALNTSWGGATGAFQYDSRNWSNSLQLAIWYLEGEFTSGNGLTLDARAKNLVKTAQDNAATNMHDVVALNLWTKRVGDGTDSSPYKYKGLAQSQLYYQEPAPIPPPPVPEPASLVILSGMGVLGALAARLKRRGAAI